MAELADRADGVLRLPSPVVPLRVGDVLPDRVAARATRRLVVLEPVRDRRVVGLVSGRRAAGSNILQVTSAGQRFPGRDQEGSGSAGAARRALVPQRPRYRKQS